MIDDYIDNLSLYYSHNDTNFYSVWVNGVENLNEALKDFLYVSLPEIGNIALGQFSIQYYHAFIGQ